MIFVTVGTQLSFDRMIRTVDEWATAAGRSDVFAQIGPGSYTPTAFESSEFLEPNEASRRFDEADLIIAHAGMGSIIGALERGTPIVIMPRRAELKEHRNDHQVATAQRFTGRDGVHVVDDEHQLTELLGRVDELASGDKIGPHASPELIDAVRAFIDGEKA